MKAITGFAVLTAAATGVAMGLWEALHTRMRCAPAGCVPIHPRTAFEAALIGLLTFVCLLLLDGALRSRWVAASATRAGGAGSEDPPAGG